MRLSIVTTTLMATGALIVPSLAYAATPPPFQSIDEYGVDQVSGYYVAPFQEGSIGSGKGVVSLIRNSGGPDQWSGILYRKTIGGVATMVVQFGPIADTFTLSGSTWVPTKANGATLVATGNLGELRYTTPEGTKIIYNTIINHDGPFITPPYQVAGPPCTAAGADPATCGIPTSITQPDGLKFTLNWDFDRTCTPRNVQPCQNPTASFRFNGPVSSAGYGFSRTYKTDVPGTGSLPVPDWFVLTGANFISGGTNRFTVSYAHPSSGVEELTDGAGRIWTFTNAADGSFHFRRPGSATDNIIVTNNPTNGTVTSVTKDGVTMNYARTVVGTTGTITTTDALSNHRTIVSDLGLGRVTSVTDELGHATSYLYDTNARLTKVTQPEGNYVQLTYDARGNVTQTKAVSKTPGTPADIIAGAAFDTTCTNVVKCNQPNTTTDPKGNVTDYVYDATHGGVTSVKLAAPSIGAVRPETRYSYAQVTSAQGALVYVLTGVSACQTTSSCTGAADEMKAGASYNSNLLASSILRGNGTGTLTATSAMTYDARGNLLTVDGPLPGTVDTTAYKYDSVDQLVGIISPDPDGAGALKNRAIRRTYRPDGQVSKQEIGNTLGQTDPNFAAMTVSQTVDIAFDSNSRPISAKLSASGTDYALTQMSYDALGRVDCSAIRMNPAIYGSLPASACTLGTSGSFGSDRISQNAYDVTSRVTQLMVAMGTSDAATARTLTYSNNGRPATLKDAEANLTTYEYDGFDRLSKTRFPITTKGANSSSTTDYEQLSYDANSNTTSRRLRDANSIAFTLDNLNRVILKDLPGSEPDVSYGYDNLGRITSVSQTGNSLAFTWDALGRRLTEIGLQGTAASEYDLGDRRTKLTYPGTGLYVNTDYLVTGEVTAIRENGATSGVGVLASYGYDDLGNRLSVTFGNTTTQTFTYDPVSRLASLTNDLSGTTNDLSVTFGNNPASQINSTVRTGDAYAWIGHGNGSTAFVSNGLNQQVTIGGSSASWDSKGNITSEPQSGKVYGYSSENLLTSSSGGVTLAYDPAMRLQQIVGAATTKLAYDDVNEIAEYDGSNALRRRFVFGPGIDEPIVQYEGTSTSDRRFMGSDERGSVISLTDSSGALLNINRYDEYGKPQTTNSGRFQYTGQKWIGEANLYDYKAREYLPHLGIFAQTDPIGYEGSPNLYAYVLADPINLIDPLGLGDAPPPLEPPPAHPCPKIGDEIVCTGSRPSGNSFCDVLWYICFGGGGGLDAINIGDPGPGGDQPPCPTGPRLTLSVGLGGTAFAGTKGLSLGGALSISIPLSAWRTGPLGIQVSLSGSLSGMIGRGAFAGAGPNQGVGYSPGPLPRGFHSEQTDVVQAGAAWNKGAEVAVPLGNMGPTGLSGSVGERAGYGAYAGGGTQKTWTYSSKQLLCKQ